MKAAASAPGKVILTGEHFVVHGEPALVMAINRHIEVTAEERTDKAIRVSGLGYSGLFEEKKFKPERGGEEARRVLEPIKISAEAVLRRQDEKRGLSIEAVSALPVAAGLGSSGASAVSTVAAVGRLLGAELSVEEVIGFATEAERFVHVNPSGIDQSISAYGGVLSYRMDEGVSRLNVESVVPVVIGNTGFGRNTGRLVDGVRVRIECVPGVMRHLIDSAGDVTAEAIDALRRGDMGQLGLLMDVNHGLLVALGVSSEELDKLVYAARRGGALGAKLTGAGGGGCVVALTPLEAKKAVAQSISEAGGTPLLVEKEQQGVRSWMMK